VGKSRGTHRFFSIPFLALGLDPPQHTKTKTDYNNSTVDTNSNDIILYTYQR
jgi:hypothetical protein